MTKKQSRKQRKKVTAQQQSNSKKIVKPIIHSAASLAKAPDIQIAPAQMMLHRMSSSGDPIFHLYPGGEDVIAERW